MNIFDIEIFPIPPESYSRKLDERVQAQEMPYGYCVSPPAADTGDYDSYARESHKQYPKHRR